MYKYNFKDLKSNKKFSKDLKTGSIAIGGAVVGSAMYFWVPSFGRGLGFIAKFAALWTMYGALWFLASSALVLIRGTKVPSLRLQDAFVLGIFAAIAHAVVWYFWW